MNIPKAENEQEILSLLRRREPAAMRLLYDRYIGYMAAVAGRYVPSEDDRKDILQESFIKIITSVGNFQHRGEGSLKAWMLRITANESLRFLRRNANQLPVEHEDKLLDMPDEPEPEGVPDDEINRMILKLPPGYRAVFNLYVFENKSHKEIAEALGITESTSASQFLRAKHALARMMREYRKGHFNE